MSSSKTPPSAAGACPFSTQASAQSPSSGLRDVPVEYLSADDCFAFLRDTPGVIARLAPKYPGSPFAVCASLWSGYFVSNPDHVREVLVDRWRDFGKGPMWREIRHLAPDGLVVAEGEPWSHKRRLLQPFFGAQRLASVIGIVVTAIQDELGRIARAAALGPLELKAEMSQLTQRVLLEALFGSSLTPIELQDLAEQLGVIAEEANLRTLLYFLPERIPLSSDRRYHSAIAMYDRTSTRIIEERRRSGGDRGDLLSLLLAVRDETSGKGLDDAEIRGELMQFYIAAGVNVASSLTWLWYLLDQNPEVARRVRAEAAAVLGGRCPGAADLSSLDYTKRAFQETLRLYPPAWGIPRYTEQETHLGAYHIPARSVLLLSPYLTHRDPQLWERPEVFDPDRFLPARFESVPRFAYYPFGGGPRVCIGSTFALMMGQLIVAMMLQEFRVRILPDQEIVSRSAVMLVPRNGIKAELERVVGRRDE